MPHAIHDAFEQFVAFPQDGVDNQAFLAKGKLTLPVLRTWRRRNPAARQHGDGARNSLATNVSGGVIPNSGHWVMEENPDATTKLIVDFLTKWVGRPRSRL